MRVLVTGGAGFIGSHVLAHLQAQGHVLCVVDNLSRGRTENVPRAVPLHMADITDAHVADIVQDFAPEAVVHLAAQMDVRASIADPVFDAQVNVLGTVRIVAAAKACGAHTFVFASSGGAIYGEAPRPTPEGHPGAPMSPYGAAKACAELYLETFARASSLRCVALRLANVYGPGQDVNGEAGVVAIFAQALLHGRAPMVFGDGQQSRDYVYVGDVAKAVGLALSAQSACGPYNIGTGISTPLTELLERLAHIIGDADGALPAPAHTQARPGEVLHSGLDASRAGEDLGWRPAVSLDQGLKATVGALRAGASPARTLASAPAQKTRAQAAVDPAP